MSSEGLTADVRGAAQQHGLAAAAVVCHTHLANQPDDAQAHRHLAQVMASQGHMLPALRCAMRACELAPQDPRSWSDLGRTHAAAGEIAHAARCFAEAVDIDPAFVDGWHNLGLALIKLGRVEAAFDSLKQALLIDPQRAQTLIAMGELLTQQEQFDDALECFERAARFDPALARARSLLGEYMLLHGKAARAEQLFRQSIALDAEHVEGWIGLARTLEDLGRANAAADTYLHALELRPTHAMAIGRALALLRTDDPRAPRWRTHADTSLHHPDTADEARALVGYGLAKHHERQGDVAAAVAAARSANAARKRLHGPLDRALLAERVDRLIATCSPEFFAARKRFGLGTDQPVFIVGLPRSGTTLVEQILSAHPRLHGAGELPWLARIASRIAASFDATWQAASLLDLEGSRHAAADYLRHLRDGAPRRRLRISDKSPLNFFHLGLAALLFPNARVIHCRRSLPDIALSTWMENFHAEQRYATDFDDFAFHATQYRRLMDHWRAALPLPVLDVDYETLVTDPQTQVRRLIEFLGAPWNACTLEFHRVDRAVQTPSRWQVRQPMYRHAVGRWRAYAPHLPELMSAFHDLCKAGDA